MTDYITEFGATRFASLFEPCTNTFGSGNPDLTDWPNNVLSVHLKVYDSGVIARGNEAVVHRVDPSELARCERLSAQALAIVGEHAVGMKSEGDDPFQAFFRVVSVNPDGVPPGPPSRVDARFVRELFAGTIAPFEPVYVEPMTQGGYFWGDACSEDLNEDDCDDEEWGRVQQVRQRWQDLLHFFTTSEELVTPSFASIGFYEFASPPGADIVNADEPPGFEMKGCCLPRMPFAFTRAGSVVGLFGHVVWT
jgi:hypothetical protein